MTIMLMILLTQETLKPNIMGTFGKEKLTLNKMIIYKVI
ncbi:protein of unknown function [Xenorhabdus poinarii G6]|uniref:Uncharacterized protein n=1 Tax=Xenorhabdus poinarii G6 TaxID=1354304 RepID=A0A068QY14_9GAMM|nr:protein of unknown function [Xenorhabdus poinarii G6]